MSDEPTVSQDQIDASTSLIDTVSRHAGPIYEFQGRLADDGVFRLEIRQDGSVAPLVMHIDQYGKTVYSA